ncbi:MAG: phospholipase D family protein [Wenzhouxiangellaceae bacterium]|nr:phospholipase D family protein [Wenzhouxiangellaceae bacterium]
MVAIAGLGMGLWHGVYKPLPTGVSVAMPSRPTPQIRFLADETYLDESGERQVEQRILDRMFDHIARAERLVVADLFLFNHFAGDPDGDDMRPLSRELTQVLIERKRERPDLRVILITDPINTFYGSFRLPQIERLREAGIDVVVSDLKPLRDSNPAWSGLWRLCCAWLGNNADGGWLPNPVGDEPVTLRGLLALPNFKANHRKTLVADTPAGWVGVVTSANPHDASSAHSNIALEFHGPAVLDLLETERAVAAFSAPQLDWPQRPQLPPAPASPDAASLQIITEAAIRDTLLDALARTGPGDEIVLAMFYLSHREVIEALLAAHARGARVRALLDPNHDAFGREKNGIPNRPVAAELVAQGIDVRWCQTTGEQCHDKLLLIRRADGRAELIAGSANFTRRNLDDLNLETNLRVLTAVGDPLVIDVERWFERRWVNAGDRVYSLDYATWADRGRFKAWLYRVMEASGLSTF